MRKAPHSRLLLVEGRTELRLLPELLEANGVNWPSGEEPVHIEPMGGFSKFWDQQVIQTELKVRGREAIGLIFDADEPEDRRWDTVVSRCRAFGVELPDVPQAGGWIAAATIHGPRFGVWMMPDNHSRGYLETFLHFLVPEPRGPLWTHAGDAVEGALQHGAEFSRQRAGDKARIHTWLAWQKEPGKQLHEAVKHCVLLPTSVHASPFVTWFRRLFFQAWLSERTGPLIVIDGPAGAGKSTVARAIAERIGATLLDTGAIYRSLAWLARERGIGWDDAEPLGELAASLRIEFRVPAQPGEPQRVLIIAPVEQPLEVTREIRTPEISEGASKVSAHPPVRVALLEIQRAIAAAAVGAGGCVAEGRDMGTVVFPQAPHKFFLTASSQARARRRHLELSTKGETASAEQVEAEMQRRDQRDSSRETAPLQQAEDAVLVDSSALAVDEVVELVLSHLGSHLGSPLGSA